MEFDFAWVLLGLPLAFGLGWVASRLDIRQMRLENRRAPKAYFRGLNFLLNEQQDKAIDAFIEAVQNDPDTSELHFALGNLFRRRGEYERAVRVHEHLISRGDLSAQDRDRAQHALALDFLKAGLLDRAEAALVKLEGTAFEDQARLALLTNCERTRNWAGAAEIAKKLALSGQGNFDIRLAHYLCEQALALQAKGDAVAAQSLLEQAVATADQALRPRLALAQLLSQQGKSTAAYEVLGHAIEKSPTGLPLIAPQFAKVAIAAQQIEPAKQVLEANYRKQASLDVLDAIVALDSTDATKAAAVGDWYVHHLERQPSLVAAAKWIAGEKFEHEQFHSQVQRALDHAVKPLSRYRCAACGFGANQHFWQCPGCQAWDSYPAHRVEEL